MSLQDWSLFCILWYPGGVTTALYALWKGSMYLLHEWTSYHRMELWALGYLQLAFQIVSAWLSGGRHWNSRHKSLCNPEKWWGVAGRVSDSVQLCMEKMILRSSIQNNLELNEGGSMFPGCWGQGVMIIYRRVHTLLTRRFHRHSTGRQHMKRSVIFFHLFCIVEFSSRLNKNWASCQVDTWRLSQGEEKHSKFSPLIWQNKSFKKFLKGESLDGNVFICIPVTHITAFSVLFAYDEIYQTTCWLDLMTSG